MTTTTNAMGSGCEVESATFHVPVESGVSGSQSGFRGKLDTLKSRGLEKVHDVQRVLGERSTSIKSNVSGQVDRVQTSMRTSPMLWAGIAAGSGFAIGLLGRFIHSRNDRRRAMPQLVIIEASC